mgnify:FL=1
MVDTRFARLCAEFGGNTSLLISQIATYHLCAKNVSDFA